MPWFAGVRREEIDWHPTIDHARCVQCGMCMNCGKHVYEWTDDGPEVVMPLECVVGCSTCRTLCRGNAIRFPPASGLRKFYEEKGVWDAVKEELIRDGTIAGE